MPNKTRTFTEHTGQWLKAEDLQGRRQVWRLTQVDYEQVPNPDTRTEEDKAVARFAESVKGLILNATQCKSLRAIFGDSFDKARGYVELQAMPSFNGKETILLTKSSRAVTPPAQQEPEPEFDDDDDTDDEEITL